MVKVSQFMMTLGCQERSGPHFLWKYLWSLPIPSKIRIFVWKACNDILPTRKLLCSRKVIVSWLCPLCDLYPESVDHSLWAYPFRCFEYCQLV
ncbi:hypothetical protein ACOSQ3_026027 [Xanthoceras sorbifolium]